MQRQGDMQIRDLNSSISTMQMELQHSNWAEERLYTLGASKMCFELEV